MIRAKTLGSLFIRSVNAYDNKIFTHRHLYSAAALGIDGFVHARDRIKLQVSNIENFKTKMHEFVKDENSKNLIFTEDLKNLLHIAEKTDVPLLSQMISKFCTQSKEVRFGNYVFGPPVMRLLHLLKDSETAMKLFQDEQLDGFFDQLITYQLLLDLLFESKQYQEVLDMFEIIKSRQVQGGRFSKHVLVLSLAACYKLNTPASFAHATKLCTEANESGHLLMRRAVTFAAALALEQGAADVALEMVSNVRQQNYLTIRTIKALALAKIKRYDDVLPIIRSILEIDNPMIPKQTFPLSAIEQLKVLFEDADKENKADFVKIVGFLEKHGHVDNNTLDAVLCTEIQQTAQFNQGSNNDRSQSNFDRSQDRGRYDQRDNRNYRDQRGDASRNREVTGRMRRPGLHELN